MGTVFAEFNDDDDDDDMLYIIDAMHSKARS